jgi:cytochrome o ubiquinol oxidase subunit 1
VLFQVLQAVYSIIVRNQNRVGEDPWNGRTLEWSTATPPSEYVFATIPTVTTRDAFWEMKQTGAHKKPKTYTDIWVPKNSGAGFIVGMFSLLFGIAVIWHMWWLLVVALVGVIITLIIYLTGDDHEVKISAEEIRETELKRVAA